jgi:hypothetical protein
VATATLSGRPVLVLASTPGADDRRTFTILDAATCQTVTTLQR